MAKDTELARPEAPLAMRNTADVMSPVTRAEVDIQITTARAYPRSIQAFKQQALAMATLDEETASGCFYALPRSGKSIEGPSVRLAEIVLSSWGNIRAGARVINVGDRELTAEGVCWDLEKNIQVSVQVKRRITDKNGRRYNDDMIVVTGNAAASIALRNAVFKVVPMVFTRAIYGAARQVAIGDAKTLVAKRDAMVTYFSKMGVPVDRLCVAVGKAGVEDIGLDQLATLKGIATAIKDGDTTIEEAFPPPPKPETGSKAERLAEKLSPAPTPEPEGAVAERAAEPPVPPDPPGSPAGAPAVDKADPFGLHATTVPDGLPFDVGGGLAMQCVGCDKALEQRKKYLDWHVVEFAVGPMRGLRAGVCGDCLRRVGLVGPTMPSQDALPCATSAQVMAFLGRAFKVQA